MDKITELITQELASANAKFPPFHSCHEAYSVIKEELEETQDAIEEFVNFFSFTWQSIKENNTDPRNNYVVEDLMESAREIIKEAIQVAAMCEKFSDFMKTQPDQDDCEDAEDCEATYV